MSRITISLYEHIDAWGTRRYGVNLRSRGRVVYTSAERLPTKDKARTYGEQLRARVKAGRELSVAGHPL